MATPTKSQTVSTPKPHLSTPSKMMASPRPGTSGNTGRPLTYKSPAVKTPASIQGHVHHVGGSSQPSSTPMAAMAVHDDLLGLHSPATALLGSLGPPGMMPLGATGDGLGLATHLNGAGARNGGAAVNPEMERLHKAQLVMGILKTRIAGRGVTREGVERVAQIHGFTTLWDDDNLTIAGNTVDLEVMFDAVQRDRVKDVSLKLNMSESEEPQPQEQGTAVLKDNLEALPAVDGIPRWKSLEAFQSNLQYLSQLDRIEGGGPCFDAVKTVSAALNKIWTAERDRLQPKTHLQHLKRSAVGRPSLDRALTLGLVVDYWSRPDGLDLKTDETSDVGPDSTTGAQPDPHLFSARISCERGAPSTILTQNWISNQVLLPWPGDKALDIEAESEPVKPDWQDPADQPDPDEPDPMTKMDTDDPILGPPGGGHVSANIVDMHFVAALLPAVHLPLNVAASLNVEVAMVTLDQDLAVTYQMALQKQFIAATQGGSETASAERWLRTLPDQDSTDPGRPRQRQRQHSYALHSAQHAGPLWCMPVQQLKFTHPRQLAAALPILRQYALVWNILQSLVQGGRGPGTTPTSVGLHRPDKRSSRPLLRSNVKDFHHRIDGLLDSNEPAPPEVIPVDLSLDVISDITKARLDMYVPLAGMLGYDKPSPFIFASLDICHNGEVEVKAVKGVHADDTDLASELGAMVKETEDVGLVVEWLLERARAPKTAVAA